MKKIMGKVKQTLSILLAVAMVVTCVPQTTALALAAEDTAPVVETTEQGTDTEDAVVDEAADVPADAEDGGDASDVSDEDSTLPDADDAEEPDETGEEPVEADEEIVEEPVEEVPETLTADQAAGDKILIQIIEETISADAGSYTTNMQGSTDTYTVPEENDDTAKGYLLTVTPTAYYNVKSVTYKLSGETAETLEAADPAEGTRAVTFEIPKAKLIAYLESVTEGTPMVSITDIVTERIQYAVTVEGLPDGAELTFDPALTGGKATAGAKLSFTIPELDEGLEVSAVTYQFAGSTASQVPEKGGDGQYTIPLVTADVTITVSVVKNVKVTFDHTNITSVNTIKVNNKPATPATLPNEDKWEIEAKTGDKVSFKLAATAPYMVTKVTVNGTPVEPAASGTDKGAYIIDELKADTKVAIETKLDPAQCYKLTVNLNGNEDSATLVSVSENDVAVSDSVGFGKTTLFTFANPTAAKVTIAVKAEEHYTVESVKKGNTTLEIVEKDINGNPVYQVPVVAGDKAKGVTVTVTTVPEDLEEGETKTVIFDKTGDHLTYAVTGAAQDEANKDKYTLSGTNALRFTITATGAYKPTVMRGTNEVKGVAGATSGKGSAKTTPYTYTIPATSLSDAEGGETITITEEPIMHTLTIEGATSEVVLVVSVDGKVYPTTAEMQAAIALDEAITYSVLEDTSVTVKATQKAGASLTSLTASVVGKAKPDVKKAAKGTAEVVVNATGAMTITVAADGTYQATLADNYGVDELKADAKGVYSVSYVGEYTAAAVYGSAKKAVTFVKAEILDGKKVLESWEAGDEAGDDDVFAQAPDGKGVTIQNLHNRKDANGRVITTFEGKKLTVNLYTDKDAAAKPVVTYTVQVSQPITSIKTQAAKATQTEGTTRYYPLTVNKNGVLNDEDFKATAADSEMVTSATIEFGKLVLTTGHKTGATTVTIAPSADGVTTPSWTFPVTVVPVLDSAKTAAPTVKLEKADDTSITLAVTAKNIAKLDEELGDKGKVFYEVKAAAKDEDLAEKEPLKKTCIEYFEKENKDTQSVTLDLANTGTSFGEGRARDYDVEVRLVYTKNGSKPTVADDGTVTGVDESSKAPAKATKFSTIKPAYETALKLKKGTTTVYTGQENILVATAQFSKTTTYTSLQYAFDASYEDADKELSVDVDYDLGTVSVSASSTTVLGKHTIEVYADNGSTEEMNECMAKIDVTVVKGIETLKVDVPSLSLYKAAKKAATLKATPVYNAGTDAPKAKKVTWKIVADKDGNPFEETDRLYGMVDVKNGTVTVNKDYVISKDGDKDSFYIQVTAADFTPGENQKPIVGYSDKITITNQAASIQTLAVVKKITEGDNAGKYQIVAVPSSDPKKPNDAAASDVNGAELYAFTSGSVEQDEVISAEDFAKLDKIPVSNLSFKSGSAKNVTINANGKIGVIKPADKVKLSVTVEDGGKAKADITFNVKYDTNEKNTLALTVEQADEARDNFTAITKEATAGAGIAAEYKYQGSSLFKLTVNDTDESGNPTEAPAYTNYTLKAGKGAKVLSITGNEALLVATAKEATVTLTNNAITDKTKNTQTYQLTNTAWSTAAAPKTTVAGSFYSAAEASEQEVALQLDANAVKALQTANTGKTLSAYAEIDWSACTDKNKVALEQIANQIALGSLEITDGEDAKGKAVSVVTLKAANESGTVKLTPGSYKLKVTIVTEETVDGKPVFTALTKAVAVTVKVDAVKAFTFAPAASYTIVTKDSNSVQITYKTNAKAEDFSVSYGLLNANVKGNANKFKQYFEIPEGSDRIQLKENVDPAKIAKDDLTGYLEYKAASKVGYYSNEDVMNVVKITIKVEDKSKAKYAVKGTPEIGNSSNSQTIVDVTANKLDVKVAYAMTNTEGWGADAQNGSIVITNAGGLPVNKSYRVDVYIVPKDSYYADKFVSTEEEVDGETITVGPDLDTYKDYGIKMTISIKTIDAMTMAQAEAAVGAWLTSVTDAEETPAWLTNDLTAETLLAQAKAGITLAQNVTFAIAEKDGTDEEGNAIKVPDFTLTNATVAADGSVKGNFTLKVGAETKDIQFNFTVPKGAITKAEAVAAIKAAATVTTDITFTNDDNTDEKKAEKQQKILEEAQKVIGEGYYVVAVKTALAIEEATNDAAGNATITLVVKAGENDTNGADVELEYEIAQLTTTP